MQARLSPRHNARRWQRCPHRYCAGRAFAPLRIVYLYPDALNLYADGGNVIALERRCAWRGIPVRVDEVHMGERSPT